MPEQKMNKIDKIIREYAFIKRPLRGCHYGGMVLQHEKRPIAISALSLVRGNYRLN